MRSAKIVNVRWYKRPLGVTCSKCGRRARVRYDIVLGNGMRLDGMRKCADHAAETGLERKTT